MLPAHRVGDGGFEREQDGIEAENQERDKEGSNKVVTVAAVADRFALLLDRWLRLHTLHPVSKIYLVIPSVWPCGEGTEYRVQSTDMIAKAIRKATICALNSALSSSILVSPHEPDGKRGCLSRQAETAPRGYFVSNQLIGSVADYSTVMVVIAAATAVLNSARQVSRSFSPLV